MRAGTAWGANPHLVRAADESMVVVHGLVGYNRSQEALLAAWLPLKGELRFMFLGNFKNTI